MSKELTEGNFHSVQTREIDENYENTRIDNYLISLMKNVPKSRIYSIIRKGQVRINGSRCKPNKKLQIGDKVRVPPYRSAETIINKPNDSLINLIQKNIIFDDKSLLVLNKPAGLASHGGSGLKLGLIEAVRQIDPIYKNTHLVHRLDRETSGVMILAKKRSTLRQLNEEWREGRVEKKYTALIKGSWPEKLASINKKLIKNQLRSGEREVKVSNQGKDSLTLVKVLKKNENFTKLECEIKTGRTHQIRVHLSSEGYPVLGDLKYGDKSINKALRNKGFSRMFLHSKSIKLPTLNLFFEADENKDFNNLLK